MLSLEIIPKESEEQEVFFQFLKKHRNITYYANVNENNTYKQDSKFARINEIKAKKAGKRSGVSDITIHFPNFILYLELKRRGKKTKKGKISYSHVKTSKEQIDFLKEINQYPYAIGFIAYGALEAIEIFNQLKSLKSVRNKQEIYNKISNGIYLNCKDRNKKYI